MKMLTSANHPRDEISDAIHSFIHFQTSQQASSLSLSSVIKNSLSGATSLPRNGPTWALTVLTSIIVLLDSSIFFRPRSIKFCLNLLAHAASHHHSDVVALHPHIWRILVWELSRIPTENFAESHVRQTNPTKGPRSKVLKVIAQVLNEGIGIALVSVLLGSSDRESGSSADSDDIQRALKLVGTMVAGKDGANPDDGLLLLNRIVSAIGTANHHTTVPAEEWAKNHLPAQAFLDGTILQCSLKKLGEVVQKVEAVSMGRVRQLSETEIVCHWDALAAIWVSCVRGALDKPLFRFWVSFDE
jgi:hypothetical protein